MNSIIDIIYNKHGIAASLGAIMALATALTLIYHLIFSILRSRFIAAYTKAPPLLRRYMYYPGLSFLLLLSSSLTFPIIDKFLQKNIPSHQEDILFL